MSPVPYSEQIEQLSPDESQILAQINEMMVSMARTVRDKHGKAFHGTHAKAVGLLKGELVVHADLPPELAQGMFAQPGRYEVVARYAPGPAEPLSDKVSAQRGLSIKVLGVEGPHILESREMSTQDWVLAVDPAFIASDAASFLRIFHLGASNSVKVPESVLIAGSHIARGVEAVLETVGLQSGNVKFLGRTPRHPVGDPYYTQTPVRYGDYIAKLAAFPTPETLAAVGKREMTVTGDNDFRDVTVAYFEHQAAEYEIKVQLCTNLQSMPIENAAVEWPQDESPYCSVASLVFPKQDAYAERRVAYLEDRLAFNPAHALELHRPLGSINRARMHAYMKTQDYRQSVNSVQPLEPRSLSEIPD